MVAEGKLKNVEYHLTIKEMPLECQPQERLLQKGAAALSNAELLAVIIRTGGVRNTALDLAYRLLAKGGLKYLVEAKDA